MFKSHPLLSWISIGVVAVGIVSSTGWWVVSNTEANQETLERVRVLSEEGPRAIHEKLTVYGEQLDDIEDRLEEIHLEIVRGKQCLN